MSDDNESLTSLLGGSSAFHAEVAPVAAVVETAPVEQPQEVKPEPKAEVLRDEAGKFAAKVEEIKPDAVVQQEKPAKTPDSALAEMSRRLKAAEAAVREYQSKQPEVVVPSVFEDEEGAINSRVDSRTSPLRGLLLQQSVKIAQLVHKDGWSDAEAGFYEAVEANPQLVEQFRNANDPGEFVYQTGVFHKELSKYGGNVLSMRDGIRAESAKGLADANARITALEAELAASKSAQADVAALPKSLNNRASGVVNAETQTDPEDIQSIARFGNSK